jgi:hypothetical protein
MRVLNVAWTGAFGQIAGPLPALFLLRAGLREGDPRSSKLGHLPPDKPPNGSPRPPPYSRESVRGIGEKDSAIAVNVL